jgi:hypothetical protein
VDLAQRNAAFTGLQKRVSCKVSRMAKEISAHEPALAFDRGAIRALTAIRG